MTQEHITLESLFAYLYGPAIGRMVAELAMVQDNERVVVLGSDRDGPAGAPLGDSVTADGSEDLGVADPLPVVDMLQWHGADQFASKLDEGWDVLVGFPPQGGQGGDGEFEDFLRLIRLTARPGARAIIMLAAGLLDRTSPWTRQALLGPGSISALVFPAGRPPRSLGVASSLRLALARWVPSTNEPVRTRIVALSAEGDVDGEFDALLSAENRWSYSSLDPERAAKLVKWAARTNARPLQELAVFPRGRAESDADLLVVSPRQITADGIDVTIESRDHDPARDGSLIRLRPGDIVGRTIGDPHWTRIGEEHDKNLGVGRQVIVIRPEAIDPAFLVAFLRSDAAALQFELAQQGSIIPRVSPRALRELLVPAGLSPESVTKSDDVIRQFRATSQGLADELDARYRAAFDGSSSEAVRSALADATGEAAMALDLLRRATDPLHRARQFLPHPLARTLRSYENSLRGGSSQDTFNDLLRFGETAITILGIVGMSFLGSRRLESDETLDWQRGFSRGGVPLGTWLAVANAGARAARESHEPLGGLAAALSTKSPLNRALDAFLAERNDQAHGAGPRSPHEYEQRILELQERLVIALDELTPLARSEWFVVSSLHWSSSTGMFTLLGRSLMGDHPDFARWEAERPTPLDNGVVFARLGNLDLPLTGFCQVRACPTCLNEELYYPDRVRGSMARVRSLDRGHQTEVTLVDLGLSAPTPSEGER